MIEIETIFQKSSSDGSWFCQDTIQLPNRAMNFGDGLFETMVWETHEIRFLDKHIQRLTSGMKVLGLDSKVINSAELVEFLTSNFPETQKRVRWNIFRAGQGKYTPENTEVIQILQISDFKQATSIKRKVDFSSQIQLFPTLWSGFKSLNALPYILANQERVERGLDEIVLLDYRGFVSEAGASNIFWVADGTFYTPSLSCSCINGVSRQVILDYMIHNSIPFLEGEFEITELEQADQIFVSNCTGISYLGNIRSRALATKPIKFLELIFH